MRKSTLIEQAIEDLEFEITTGAIESDAMLKFVVEHYEEHGYDVNVLKGSCLEIRW